MAHCTVKAADWLKARCAEVPLNSCLIRAQRSSTLTFGVLRENDSHFFAGDRITVHLVLNGSQCRQIERGKKSGKRGHYGKCSLSSWNDFSLIAESIGTEMIVTVWRGQEGKDLGKWSNGEKKIFPENWIVENCFFLSNVTTCDKMTLMFFGILTTKKKKSNIFHYVHRSRLAQGSVSRLWCYCGSRGPDLALSTSCSFCRWKQSSWSRFRLSLNIRAVSA